MIRVFGNNYYFIHNYYQVPFNKIIIPVSSSFHSIKLFVCGIRFGAIITILLYILFLVFFEKVID